jgi:hypothetical protein
MTEDRNKSTLTKQVTTAAVNYLDEHGCKPVETEVPLCAGWVADIASVICPTQTELIAMKLLRPRPAWRSEEMPGWKLRLNQLRRVMTVACEVKVSRGDFIGDHKWEKIPPTDLAYVAVSWDLKGLAAELPGAWGVILVQDGAARLLRAPLERQATTEQQRDVILQVAIRRDHDTRHERLRKIRRHHLDYQNENKTLTRMSHAIQIANAVAAGKYSPEEACARHGVKLPAYCMEQLATLVPGVQG